MFSNDAANRGTQPLPCPRADVRRPRGSPRARLHPLGSELGGVLASGQQADGQPVRAESGRHVRSCLCARGLTEEALAGRSGLSADTIRRLEKGTFSPPLETLRRLCMGLQMQLSTLFDSFELGEREAARELGDALAGVTPEVQKALLQLVAVLRRQRGED